MAAIGDGRQEPQAAAGPKPTTPAMPAPAELNKVGRDTNLGMKAQRLLCILPSNPCLVGSGLGSGRVESWDQTDTHSLDFCRRQRIQIAVMHGLNSFICLIYMRCMYSRRTRCSCRHSR